MTVSILFSVVIYNLLHRELKNLGRIQRYKVERGNYRPPEIGFIIIDPGLIEEAENRLKLNLVLINVGILILSGAAGYFLAGRTLQPIKEMIDEQNRFVTDASHELRTPLTALRSEIEVALRDPRMDKTEAKKILNSNLEEVLNLQQLSDNLIKLTQYRNLAGNLQFEKISLKTVANEAIKKVTPLAKQKQITISSQMSSISLEADKASLVELLVILLDNAIKYSPEKSSIIIEAVKSHDQVQVKVIDQGFGIEKDEIKHLFDRFYRADQSRSKENIPGYGLGLSIAKQIVERHGGTIEVESEIGQGSTFFVKLPIKHS